MTTITHTPEAVGRTSTIAVGAPTVAGRVRVRLGSTGATDCPYLRPVLLTSDARSARVALVPDGALLLADDAVALHVDVADGARLDLVEPAGTVAYDMHGRSASWDVHLRIGAGAVVVWHGEPFVVSAGARVRRTTRIELAERARLALRETLVLGRTGEMPGELDQRLEATGPDGVPVLAEGVRLDRERTRILLGGRRVMDSMVVLGATPAGDPGPERLDLETGGTVLRRLADEAHRGLSDATWADAVAAATR